MLKGALEADGIACFIKNEFGEGGGEIGNPMAASMGYSVPELWVLDDSQFERAREIAESLQPQDDIQQPAEDGTRRITDILVFIFACPAGALLGWFVGGMIAMVPNLVLRAAVERHAIPDAQAETAVAYILAIATFFGGVGFIKGGQLAGRITHREAFQSPKLLFTCLVLCLLALIAIPADQQQPLWTVLILSAGFVAGGLVALGCRQHSKGDRRA
jgi:uncharacterized membrane protein YoaK (UPF0700 family)